LRRYLCRSRIARVELPAVDRRIDNKPASPTKAKAAGGKLTTWEGGMRAPMVVRWPGHVEPGTVKNEMFSALDWAADLG
jgi:hypothetical protein